jgi:putative hydrolase of the HAD superfamily
VIRLICLDADDTLWHNMRHFAAAEDAFAAVMAGFGDAAAARARLHAVEERNLPRYGYGAKSFTLSMIEAAAELCPAAVPVADLLAIGRDLLAHPVDLLPGTADALAALAERGELVLVTKGDLLHQETKIAVSGLAAQFSAVDIVSDKSAATFTRLFARHGVAPDEAVMAGDSLRSDVLPALAAGAWAAYIPQPLAWHHEAATVPDHPRFATLASLADLPGWIEAIG